MLQPTNPGLCIWASPIDYKFDKPVLRCIDHFIVNSLQSNYKITRAGQVYIALTLVYFTYQCDIYQMLRIGFQWSPGKI